MNLCATGIDPDIFSHFIRLLLMSGFFIDWGLNIFIWCLLVTDPVCVSVWCVLVYYGLTFVYFGDLPVTSMFSHGSELTCPCVTEETCFFDTPIISETRPGRICVTPLRMAELAETRAEAFVPGGDGGLGVGLRAPGVLSHTNTPIHINIKPLMRRLTIFHCVLMLLLKIAVVLTMLYDFTISSVFPTTCYAVLQVLHAFDKILIF